MEAKETFRIRPSTPKVITTLRQEAARAEEVEAPEDPDLEAVKELTGLSAGLLLNLKKAELKVDCRSSYLHLMGQYCPQLVELKLSNSYVTSLRDLGTTFYRLEVLWIVRTQLRELDGLSGLPSLKELYAAFNSVENLSGVLLNNTLEILDLEGNEVSDWEELSYLSSCDSVSSLTLEGNPISRQPQYRERIFELIPHLQLLDDLTRGQSPAESEPLIEDSQIFLDSPLMKKYSVGLTEFTSAIPQEPDEYDIVRASVKQRHNAKFAERNSRPKTAGSRPSNIFMPDEDVSSHLTEDVFVGNPLKALRHKRERLFKTGDGGLSDIFSLLKAFKIDDEPHHRRPESTGDDSRRASIRVRARQVVKRTTPRIVGDFSES